MITCWDDLLQANMPQVGVGNIAYEDPANFEDALPLILVPDGAAPCVIDLSHGTSARPSLAYHGYHLPASTSLPYHRSDHCVRVSILSDRLCTGAYLALTLKKR